MDVNKLQGQLPQIKSALREDKVSVKTVLAVEEALQLIKDTKTTGYDRKELQEAIDALHGKLQASLQDRRGVFRRVASAVYRGMAPFCKSLQERGLSADKSVFISSEVKAFQLIEQAKQNNQISNVLRPMQNAVTGCRDWIKVLSPKDMLKAFEDRNIHSVQELLNEIPLRGVEEKDHPQATQHLLTDPALSSSFEDLLFTIYAKLESPQERYDLAHQYRQLIRGHSLLSNTQKEELMTRTYERELAEHCCMVSSIGSGQVDRELNLLSLIETGKPFKENSSLIKTKLEQKHTNLMKHVGMRKNLTEEWNDTKKAPQNSTELQKLENAPSGVSQVFSLAKGCHSIPWEITTFTHLYNKDSNTVGKEKMPLSMMDTKAIWGKDNERNNKLFWTYCIDKSPSAYALALIRGKKI